jgi:sugar phosphate isomerase/epimerase
MKIGTGVYLEKLKQDLNFYQERYDVLEIQDFIMPDNLEKNRDVLLGEYKCLLKDYEGTLTLHGPYIDLHPTSFDPLIREVSIQRYRQTLMVAKALNAEFMVIHSDYDLNKVYEGYEDYLLQQNIALWENLIKEFEDAGITAVIENIHNKTPHLIKRIIHEINSPYLKACLDTGHAHVFGKSNLVEWVDEYKQYLAYIHLHDNNGEKDQHLPIGEGNIDFKDLFDKLRKKPHDFIVVCEIFGDIHQQQQNLKELENLMR